MHVTHTFRYTVTQTPSNIHNLTHTHARYENRSFFQIFSQVQNITNEQFLYSSNVIYKGCITNMHVHRIISIFHNLQTLILIVTKKLETER